MITPTDRSKPCLGCDDEPCRRSQAVWDHFSHSALDGTLNHHRPVCREGSEHATGQAAVVEPTRRSGLAVGEERVGRVEHDVAAPVLTEDAFEGDEPAGLDTGDLPAPAVHCDHRSGAVLDGELQPRTEV